mgnify:CR=1 FL=1
MKTETFKLSLGTKRHTDNPVRNDKDYTREILVDFDARPGQSLGLITAIHETHGDSIDSWALFDFNGDDLPGVDGLYSSLRDAMNAARSVVAAFTGCVPAGEA